MRFVQYFLNNGPKTAQLGLRLGQEIICLKTINSKYPNTLIDLLKQEGTGELDENGSNNSFINELERVDLNGVKERINMSEVTLDAPIRNPDKLICVGMNYKDHCEEQNIPVPLEPIFFTKFASNIIGPFSPIKYPSITKELDYEVELAFVIGKSGKDISVDRAMEHVFGYTVAHDVSARDWQFNKNGGQWLLGKGMDDFCPIGPEVVTTHEIRDPHSLDIKCFVNGDIKQNSNTSQIVHRIDHIVSYLSKIVTLLPGDLILTGTPPGVGVFQKPQFFLKRGDIVKCEIGGIGIIQNEIV